MPELGGCFYCSDTGIQERYPVTDKERDNWGIDQFMRLPCRWCEKGDEKRREDFAQVIRAKLIRTS